MICDKTFFIPKLYMIFIFSLASVFFRKTYSQPAEHQFCLRDSIWRCIYIQITHFSIDATNIQDRLAKYVNDAAVGHKDNNSLMKIKVFDNYPRLCLYAKRDIECGEELRYDYEDSFTNLFWRQKVNMHAFYLLVVTLKH